MREFSESHTGDRRIPVMPIENSERTLAYALLRVAFGVNFFGHGMFRILSGVVAFASATAQNMEKSPLPHGLLYIFGLAIPFIEVLIGVALVLGIGTRITLVCGSLFMMALTTGIASIQKWDVASQQLSYSLIFFILLFGLKYNLLSCDHWFATRR